MQECRVEVGVEVWSRSSPHPDRSISDDPRIRAATGKDLAAPTWHSTSTACGDTGIMGHHLDHLFAAVKRGCVHQDCLPLCASIAVTLLSATVYLPSVSTSVLVSI